MSQQGSMTELLPALHHEVIRLLPARHHGRIRPSDLAQTTAQILLKSRLTGIGCVMSWSRGIIRKLIAKEFSRSRRQSAPSRPGWAFASESIHAEGVPAPVFHESADSFDEMISAAGLDPESRAILSWYFIDGRSLRSIAEEAKLPLSTLHGRFHEALGRVREACGGRFGSR